MWRRLALILLLVLVAVAACGDDESVFEQGGPDTASTTTDAPVGTATETTTTSSSTTTTTLASPDGLGAEEQAMADLIAADLLAETDAGLPIDEASAQCLGSQVVATIGLDRLQELQAAAGAGDIGTALELMSPEEQATLIGVVLQGAGGEPPCLDVQGLLVDSLTESGLSEGSAQCVAEAFTQGTVLQDLLGLALAGEGGETAVDPQALAPLLTVFATCLTPEELAQMGDLMGDLGS